MNTDGNLIMTSLTPIPPSPVSDRIELDIRATVHNGTAHTQVLEVFFYLDTKSPSALLHRASLKVAAGSTRSPSRPE